MKLLKSLFLIAIMSFISISCSKEDHNTDQIEITGKIYKSQSITTYQYGTHFASGYAIKSHTINLDDYLNQNVTIIGHKIDGYPVDGGPEYLEVEKIK